VSSCEFLGGKSGVSCDVLEIWAAVGHGDFDVLPRLSFVARVEYCFGNCQEVLLFGVVRPRDEYRAMSGDDIDESA
jgi:hypothetical protein